MKTTIVIPVYNEGGNIRSTLIVSLALMEALAIYGLLIAFMLISQIH